ncbi:hypothetical protein LQW54_008984 [Pestalotiopsis sp. IQ-011]
MMRPLDLKTRHLSGTKLLTETSAKLGLDMLGKPAYAIVMKDGGKYKPKREFVDAEEIGRKVDLEEIEALLGNHRTPATAAEVHENIDGLRPPKTDLVLQQKDFDWIQTRLVEGFLKEQLLQYISTFEPDSNTEATTDSVETPNTKEEQNLNLEDQYQWISKAVSWVPLDPYGGIPGHHDRSSLLLHAYLPPDSGPKTRAAVRIMRECWGLQMEEIANGIGECRVTLQTKHFWPLMRGAQDQLRSITKSYLEEGETMETFVPTKKIRILAPRYKCELVLAEIDKLIGKIRSYTFPISHVTSDPTMVTEAVLDLVGKVTNTHVRFAGTGNRLQVAWLQSASHDKSEVETLSHVVFRFLRTALQPEPATRTLHSTNAEAALATKDARLTEDHSNQDKRAWKDRLSSWARLASPTSAPSAEIEVAEATNTEGALPNLYMKLEDPRSPLSHPSEKQTEDLDQTTGSTEPPSESSAASPVSGLTFQESTRFPYQPVRWSEDLKTTTAGKFGHVLSMFDRKTDSTSTTKPDLENLAARAFSFSPIVPHPLTLANLSPSLKNKNELVPTRSTILVRFFHNHDSAVRALPLVAPPLELRLALSEPRSVHESPKITGVHSLRAFTATHHDDVLLPASPVDLRITQTRGAALLGSPGALSDWQPIADFLARSHLDFGAGKLEMAKQQRFQVPLRLFSQSSTAPPTKKKRSREQKRQEDEVTQGGDPLRSTLYEFAGLELHRAVAVPFPEDDRFDLVYTSIEAGQGGGRRAELSLQPASSARVRPSSSTVADTDRAYQDDFLRACFKLAQTAKNWSGFFGEWPKAKKN